MTLCAWKYLVIVPLMLLYLVLALIIPLVFLYLFGDAWLLRNPINSWILGSIIYVTTCYILSTSPDIIRLSRYVLMVEKRLAQTYRDQLPDRT